MIVFGRNHFLVKKVKPEEIGLNDAEFKGNHFELRQKYAHLYYIPLFPIGQEWFLRKNRDLYLITQNTEDRLKSKFPSFLDWKAFALPLLLIAGGIIFFIMESVSHLNYEKESKIDNSNEIKVLQTQINNLNTYCYLKFKDKNEYRDIFYKVNKIAKDSIEVIEYEKPLPQLNQEIQSKTSYNSNLLLYLQLSKAKINAKIWIKKTALVKSIKDNYNNVKKDIVGLNNNEPMELESIFQIADAQFIVNTNDEAKSIYYFEIQNLGLEAKIDSIVSDKKENWIISKKRQVKLEEKFAIRTENGEKATLYYTTIENKQQHSIKLKRNNGQLRIVVEII